MKREILSLDRITVIQEESTILHDVNLRINAGEIVGLITVTGLGVDALIDVMVSNTPIHYGSVYYDGKRIHSYHRPASHPNPVAIIEKQSRLVESLTVADNIFVLRRNFRSYLVKPRMMEKQIQPHLEDISRLGITIPVGALVADLSPVQRLAVEILKAVMTGIHLVILRNISTFVSVVDLALIHELIRSYAARGMAFLYVCNHHQETFTIATHAAIMEDGTIRKVLRPAQMNDMVMEAYASPFSQAVADSRRKHGQTALSQGDERLCCSALSYGPLQELTFSLHAGECIVLLDMNNSIFTPLQELLMANAQPESGSITIMGSAPRTRDRRVSFIQEHPARTMLFPDLSVVDNLCFMADGRVPHIWSDSRMKDSIIQEYTGRLGNAIHSPNLIGLPEKFLYELVYCRVMLQRPALVICSQPFEGADMYQRARIISLLDELGTQGIATLILAVDLSDSLETAHRLLVVRDGRISESYERSDFPQVRLLSGSKPR